MQLNRKSGDKMKFRRILLVIALAFFVNISAKAAVGEWIGDYCESCGDYGSAGECDKVHTTTVGIFRVSFYLNGKKLGSSVNVSSNTTYQQNAMNAKWHWGDGTTDIVSYANGTGLGNPNSGGLSSIVISGISTSNVQTLLSPKKNSANVQKVLNQAGITEFKFKNGKIYYVPPEGECEGDYEIQMIVESMQIINWLCNSTGTSSHTWIGTPYELNNGLLAQGYNSHTGGNGYMSGSIVDKDLLSSLRIDKNVKVGNVSFEPVADCLTIHIRGYDATQGYGFNVYNLTGDFEIECDEPKECCIPCTDFPGIKGCDPDDCCYDDDLPISTDGTTEACVPWDEYWSDEKFKEYCEEPEEPDLPSFEGCKFGLTPEFKIKNCEEDEENIEFSDEYEETINRSSYFRDPIFSSDGILANLAPGNIYDSIYDYLSVQPPLCDLKPCLPENWLDEAASNDGDNTFLALAYSSDSRYTFPIIDGYCTMYCQELFEVELPDNYPYVNAGRYFKWTVKDYESTLVISKGAMLCTNDINLDKFISEYQKINKDAKKAASDLANLTCEGKYGVANDLTPNSLANPGFENDLDYLAAYERTCIQPLYKDFEFVGYCEDGSTLWVATDEWTKAELVYNSGVPSNDSRTNVTREGYEYNFNCGGNPSGPHLTTQSELNLKQKKFDDDVVGMGKKVEDLINILKVCNNNMKDYEIDMQVELNYQTLFKDEYYYTPDAIQQKGGNGLLGHNHKCIDETTECNKDEHIFTLSERNAAEPITCGDNAKNWMETKFPEGNKGDSTGGHSNSIVWNPVEANDSKYNVNDIEFLTGVSGYDRTSGEFLENGERKKMTNFWHSIDMTIDLDSTMYELNEKINACICKDGEVLDVKDGICTCEREASYKDFTQSYNNYQQLPDGTLSVEFMNPSGLYPISLRYWNIGNIEDDGKGHFDKMFSEYGVCDEQTGCMYGDPNGVCRFIIKNRIIATPDNNGDCEEPPCDPEPDDNGKCNNEPCDDPDNFADCIDSSGRPICEKSTDLNIIYRVIDLDNPFPGTDAEGRTPGVNWIGHEDIITNNREVDGSAIYNSGVEPLYSMTLTPALIKEIRSENYSTFFGYTSSMMYPEGPAEPGGGYSLFLHNYLDGNMKIKYDDREQFSHIQETGDGVK